MTTDHVRIEELLAGYVLGGLDEDDASLAERALVDHVPGCEDCRRALEEYRSVAGDLGLLAPPAAPPETLLVRLRRGIGVSSPRRRRGWGVAAAAALAVAGMAGWNAILLDRVSEAEDRGQALGQRLEEAESRQELLAEVIPLAGHPDGSVVPMEDTGEAQVMLLYVPRDEHLYVIGTRLPEPRNTYVVWFLREDEAWTAGSMEPEGGVAIMRVETDPDRWDRVVITDEASPGAPTPSASPFAAADVDAP